MAFPLSFLSRVGLKGAEAGSQAAGVSCVGLDTRLKCLSFSLLVCEMGDTILSPGYHED